MTETNSNGKRLITQQSVDQAVKSICDIMRRGNCAAALQYVPELTWILFLRILDEREEQEAEALALPFRASLEAPYRWRDWGAPEREDNKRQELQEVRKKTPLTLQHFDDFFRVLPNRAESELSWTVDMDERKQIAAAEAKPLADQATAKRQQEARWNERLKELKKAKPRDELAIAEAEAKVKTLKAEARALANDAKRIEDAVYDLKAVNPHKRPVVDTRTPEELMDIIEAKGQEVAEALAVLRN